MDGGEIVSNCGAQHLKLSFQEVLKFPLTNRKSLVEKVTLVNYLKYNKLNNKL